MSIVSYGLGPVGLGATNVVFGTIEAVEIEDNDIDVNLVDEIGVDIEQTPDINIEIDGDIGVTIEDDPIKVDIICP